MHESPIDPDYPHALFRVMCPVCGVNLWADNEPPPVEGDEIIAEHTCQGRNPELDVTPEDQQPPATPAPLAFAARASDASDTPAPPPQPRDAPVPRDPPPPPPKRKRTTKQ